MKSDAKSADSGRSLCSGVGVGRRGCGPSRPAVEKCKQRSPFSARVRRPQEQARRIWKSDGPVFRGSTLAPPDHSAHVRSGSRFQHMPRQTAGLLGAIDAPAPVGRPIIHGQQRGPRRLLRPQGAARRPPGAGNNQQQPEGGKLELRGRSADAGDSRSAVLDSGAGAEGRGQDQLARRGRGRPLEDERAAPPHAPPCALVRGSARSGHWTGLGLRELKAGEPGGCDCSGASDPRSRSGVAVSRRTIRARAGR